MPIHSEPISWQLALRLATKLADDESLTGLLAALSASQENHPLWQVTGLNQDSDTPRRQLCLWPDEAALQMASWRELSQPRLGSYRLTPRARRVQIEKITLTEVQELATREPQRVNALAESLAHLPPYTASEIAQAAKECDQATPERVWAWVDFEDIPLLLGRDADGTPRVRFPASWPAGPRGRAGWHVQCATSALFDERALGAAARPYNWIVPVARVDEAGNVRWGLIDLEGRFVLPCEYGYLSRPEAWLGGKPPKLPEGRREPWLWVMARREPLVLPDDALAGADLPLTAADCDVIEVWSGAQVNPPRCKALAETLECGKFLVRGAEDHTDEPRLGRMQAGQPGPGPLAWRWIAHGLTGIGDRIPAKDADTGLYAYIDSKGDTALSPRYSNARRFNSGIAEVRLTVEAAQAEGILLSVDNRPYAPWGVINEMGDWVLPPRWREIEDEYDGHFMVQAEDGSWGVVTPAGKTVVPFLQTIITGAIGEWLKERFKRVQARRFHRWMRTASDEGSLAVLAGKLHSSYGAYDYGALPISEETIRVIRPVTVTGQYYAAQDSGPRDVLLEPGMCGRWKTGARHYAHFVDLSTHAVVEIDDLEVHELKVPWDALALTPAPPVEFDDPAMAARFAHLNSTEHREALMALIEAMEEESERLYSSRLAAQEKKQPEPSDLASVENLTRDYRSLKDHLLNLYFLEICLNRNDAHMFCRIVERLEQATPSSESPAIKTALTNWLKFFRG